MKVILHYLLVITFLSFYSCTSHLSPYSPIFREHFSFISPGEEEWILTDQNSFVREYKYETGELIWMKKGSPGGAMTTSDYPIQCILILRDTLLHTDMDSIKIISELDDIVKVKVNHVVDSLIHWAPSMYNFHYDSLNNRNDYLNYFYSISWERDTVGTGQYYAYLPKFYREYKCYYLFIYNEFPARSLGNELTGIIKNFKCIEDSLAKN
jgi:hypothetical protein